MAQACIEPKIITLSTLGLLLPHDHFYAPGRNYFENRGWDIPFSPAEKVAYNYALMSIAA